MAGASFGVFALLILGIRSVAFGDYEAETLPAIQALTAGHFHEFLTKLTAYGGATLMQAPFYLGGSALGGELSTFRASAVPGAAILFVVAVMIAPRAATRFSGTAAIAGWSAATAFLIAGSPIALLAVEAGHPEDLLVVGGTLVAVLLARGGRPVVAAAAVAAAAAAKPWALIAVPVVLCSAADWRQLVRQSLAVVVVSSVVLAPIAVAQHGDRGAVAPMATQATGIFKPMNVFWFAGASNPEWSPERSEAPVTQHIAASGGATYDSAPRQRLEPTWVGRISHPAVVLLAVALALVYSRMRGRDDGRGDLLLLLAAVSWWRCLLDSWNTDYYAFAAVAALVLWEALRHKPPILGSLLTLAVWVSFVLLPDTLTPDARTAVYLLWALPVGVALVWRAVHPASARDFAARAVRPIASRLPTLASLVRGSSATMDIRS